MLIPRATTHRWVPGRAAAGSTPIEANSHIAPPKRYLSRYGQLLEHAPYCERDLHGPDRAVPGRGRSDVEVLVKHRAGAGIVGTRMTYATHPFDVVGWDGCLYPYTFNIEDYMPITGKIHQPPPVHQVFEGWNFVICNFLPRKVDYHPLSIPVPYYHSNVDSDEVMFYVGGDYEARKGSGIDLGSISLHPGGYAHGPQPAAIEASLGAEYFDESAVMVDTFAPLDLGEGGLAAEDPAYAWTWAGRPGSGPGARTWRSTRASMATAGGRPDTWSGDNSRARPAEITCASALADGRDPGAPRRAAGRPARDERTPDAAAAAAVADRGVVLPRPLRAGPRRRDRRHEGGAAPAHRAADRELAVRRRDRAPRQRRQPRAGAARRAQPDDRRPRHHPLRGLHAGDPRCCTASSCGSRCPTATGTPSRASPTTRPTAVTGDGWEARVFLGSLLGSTSPVATFTPLLGAELILDGGTTLDLEVDPSFEHGVLVDFGVRSASTGSRSRPSSTSWPTSPPGRATADR